VKFDIVLAGVGGQGVLSLAAVIARAAMADRLSVKQSEVHGMSQRGGAVVAHLRLGDSPVASELIPLGSARLVLSLEPLESLRYLDYLSPHGVVVTSTDAVRNIPDYPDEDRLVSLLNELRASVLVDSTRIARACGAPRAGNMVMIGAAADYLPVRADSLERAIGELFARKGDAVVAQNLRAFRMGRGMRVAC
jgi:indolepyruvate ferredoxin oxidoreductase, beta subunit